MHLQAIKKYRRPIPENAKQEKRLEGGLDLVLLFATNKKELNQYWKQVIKMMKADGSIWVAYPKKSSGIPSDLSMMDGWEITGNTGWDGVSLISIDDNWSAARFRYKPETAAKPKVASTENIYDNDGLLCIDKKQRIITPSKDFLIVLKKNADAKSFFEALSFTNRKEYVEWIITSKKEETRKGAAENSH
jgi:DNA modification methylase